MTETEKDQMEEPEIDRVMVVKIDRAVRSNCEDKNKH